VNNIGWSFSLSEWWLDFGGVVATSLEEKADFQKSSF
jgi:hypothetical protein